jgi:hypothetical protein
MSREQFSYIITRNGKLFIYWHGKRGKSEIVLAGARAERLISVLPTMTPEQQQLALARAAGNFKRGNERPVR